MTNQITVTVSGCAGSGKSTIAYLVSRYLKQKGFETELNLLDVPPDGMEVGIVPKTNALIMKNTKVIVNEVQTRRPIVIPTPERIAEGKEPTEEDIQKYISEHSNMDYYNAREHLREIAYGGKPPAGFADWGTYWKSV